MGAEDRSSPVRFLSAKNWKLKPQWEVNHPNLTDDEDDGEELFRLLLLLVVV